MKANNRAVSLFSRWRSPVWVHQGGDHEGRVLYIEQQRVVVHAALAGVDDHAVVLRPNADRVAAALGLSQRPEPVTGRGAVAAAWWQCRRWGSSGPQMEPRSRPS